MIYVDYQQGCERNERWRWDTVSHLSCDPTDDLEPLHRFAAGLGLQRSWFQPRGGIMPHYDLSPTKRLMALQRGATELGDNKAIVAVIRAWRTFQGQKRADQADQAEQGTLAL